MCAHIISSPLNHRNTAYRKHTTTLTWVLLALRQTTVRLLYYERVKYSEIKRKKKHEMEKINRTAKEIVVVEQQLG